MDKRLFDIVEISEYLGIGKSRLYGWVAARKIPWVNIDGLLRFDLRRIDTWIEECSVEVEKAPEKDRRRFSDKLHVEIEAKKSGQKEWPTKKKPCKTCGEPKVLGDYYEDKRLKDGHGNDCKACLGIKAQKRWIKIKARRKAERETKKKRGKVGQPKKERAEEKDAPEKKKVPWAIGGECEILNNKGEVIFKNGKTFGKEGEEWLRKKRLLEEKRNE